MFNSHRNYIVYAAIWEIFWKHWADWMKQRYEIKRHSKWYQRISLTHTHTFKHYLKKSNYGSRINSSDSIEKKLNSTFFAHFFCCALANSIRINAMGITRFSRAQFFFLILEPNGMIRSKTSFCDAWLFFFIIECALQSTHLSSFIFPENRKETKPNYRISFCFARIF